MTPEQEQALMLLRMEVVQTGGIMREMPLHYQGNAPVKVDVEYQNVHAGPSEPPILTVTRLILPSGTWL